MKIRLEVDVTLEDGRNFARAEVAEKLAEEVDSMRTLYMEDERDTRYTVHSVTPIT